MRRRGEQGFAMLLVFVMAASVAIMLYRELPRVAFEAQRNKEDLLIERGEQYSRAIQLYVRKWKKYPATMEDLESTNQVRFLRKRYIDPMTGKGEWRIVHVGAGGVFLDSLVHKPPSLDKKDEAKAVNTFTYEAPTTGSTVIPGQTAPGFQQTRPSERRQLPQPGQSTDPANPQGEQGVNNPNQPGLPNPNQTGVVLPPGVPGVPGASNTPQGYPLQPVIPPGTYPVAYPGQPVNSQTGGVSPSPFPYSTQPGAQGAPPPFGQPGTTTTPGQNQALSLINQILTTPRSAAAAAAQPMAGLQIGGGIAGVASTVERSGIKIYNEKEKYNEWEFLYDLTKDKNGMGAALGAGIQQQQQVQPTTQNPFGQQVPGLQPGMNNPQFPGQFPGQIPGQNPVLGPQQFPGQMGRPR